MLSIGPRTAVVFTTFLVAEVMENRRLRRHNRSLSTSLKDMCDLNEEMSAELDYMINLINQNQVKLDEFDLIVMPHVIRKPED